MDPRLIIFNSDFKLKNNHSSVFNLKIIASAKKEPLNVLIKKIKENPDFFFLTKEDLKTDPNLDQFLNALYFNKQVTNNDLNLISFIQKDSHFKSELKKNLINDLVAAQSGSELFFLRPLLSLDKSSSDVFKNYLKEYFLSQRDLDELYFKWYPEADSLGGQLSESSKNQLFQATTEVFMKEFARKTVDLAFLDVLKVLDPKPGQIGFDKESFRELLTDFEEAVYKETLKFISKNNLKNINEYFFKKAYLKGLKKGVLRLVCFFSFNVLGDNLSTRDIARLGREKSTEQEILNEFRFLIDFVDNQQLKNEFSRLLNNKKLTQLKDYELLLIFERFSDSLAGVVLNQENILKAPILLKPAKELVSNLNYALYKD